MRAADGTVVKSPINGTVIAVGTNPNYFGGRYVIVREDSKNHYEYYMGHLSVTSVKVNAKVKQGQSIARSGHSGSVTAPHLHFEIHKYRHGALLNPITVYGYYNPKGVRKVINPKPIPRPPSYYRVRSGDTVDKISRQFKLNRSSNYVGFRRLNPSVKNVNKIAVNQRVRIK